MFIMSVIPSEAVVRQQNSMVKIFNDTIPFSSAFSFDGVHQRQNSKYTTHDSASIQNAIDSISTNQSRRRLQSFVSTVSKQIISSIASKGK